MNVDPFAMSFDSGSAALFDLPLPEGDQAWETDLLSLLCVLEMVRTRLQEVCRNNQAVQALDEMLALIGPVRAFLDSRPELLEYQPIAELLWRLEEFSARVMGLRRRLHRTAWQQVVRLFSGAAEEGDPFAQFVACAELLEEVLADAFDLFAALFESPAAARGWNDARELFLADLHELIEQLRR